MQNKVVHICSLYLILPLSFVFSGWNFVREVYGSGILGDLFWSEFCSQKRKASSKYIKCNNFYLLQLFQPITRLLNIWNYGAFLWLVKILVECFTSFLGISLSAIWRIFFILQSLTTSKMRKFQTVKLSQFQIEKTCWIENQWSSGIMSNFWGDFFYVFGDNSF